jgi:hypothetical protein
MIDLRRAALVVAVLAVPASAVARPLPKGLTIKLVKGRVVARRGGVTVPVVDGATYDRLGKAALSADGTAVVFAAHSCWADDADAADDTSVPLAQIEAGFENQLGMKAHLAKKYPDAIAHFARAAADDPATPVYATNLLSAQSLGGKLAEADQTLAAYAPKNPAWFAWRLAVDPDLKPLRGRPSTRLTSARGTAHGSLAAEIAYSPLGLIAHEVPVEMYDGIPDGSGSWALSIVEVASGRELLTLPTESTCAVDTDAAMSGNPNPPPLDKACAKRVATEARAQRKVTDAVLADLGFAIAAHGWVDTLAAEVPEFTAPDGRKVVGHDDDTYTLDGAPIALGEDRVYGLGFVPHAIVAAHKGAKQLACGEADGAYRFELSVTPTR